MARREDNGMSDTGGQMKDYRIDGPAEAQQPGVAQPGGMTATAEIDNPVLKQTPGGWMAEAMDSPLIAVVAATEADAVELFRARRAVWREEMAQASKEAGRSDR